VKVDTRTAEEKKTDDENNIAGVIALGLGGFIAVTVLMQGAAAWWIPLIMGVVIWIGVFKALKGPLRIIPILVYKLIVLIGTLIAWALISLLAAGALYVVIKCIQGMNQASG
jgi:hypothetical protein